MKKLLIPLILMVVGIGGGVGAGLFLAPPEPEVAEEALVCPEPAEDAHGDADTHAEDSHEEEHHDGPAPARDYAKLNNQFVIPVVEEGRVAALVVLSVSVEVDTGQSEQVYAHEPKLRDGFLQVLFDHANTGGFGGAFTNTSNMRSLRDGLRETAQRIVGDVAHDVLIIEIVRQDV